MLTTFAKATYAAVIAGLGAISTALVGAHTFAAISASSYVTAALAALVSGGVVYGVPNTSKGAPPPPVA